MNAQLDGNHLGNTRTHAAKPLRRGANAPRFGIVALLLCVTVGVAAWSAHKPALWVQGEVQATELRVVPKVIGRVQALQVREGDKVRKGQLLVSLQNEELQARLDQARRAMELASEHNKIVRAACVEDICAQSNWWVKVKAVAEQAEQSVNRSRALHAAEVISLHELQVLEEDLDRARSSERAAKASFDLAVAVYGNEGNLAAAANLEQASRTVAELEALVAQLALTSPIDGEVQGPSAGEGQLAALDLPVVRIVDPRDVWVRFNLPEDLLPNIRLGTTLRVRVLALGNEELSVKVNYISPNGGFATGRAAKGTRGIDLRTFEVRAVPVQATDGLRSGMSAQLIWRKFD